MATGAAAAAGRVRIGDREVNRMGFGALRIATDRVHGRVPDPAVARAVLRRAVELGVELIDTAHSYGPETSERLIAEALHPYPPGLLIATKAGLGPPRADARPATLRRECERSLQLLRVERLDLLQLHRVDPEVPVEESVGELARLRDEGKVAAIGLSNVSVDQLARARAVAPIASVQNRYSAGDRESEEVLEACERDGIAFMPWYPLGRGSLAEGEAADGMTPAQAALVWLLRRSPVIAPIPGTSTLAHLEENVAAAGYAGPGTASTAAS
ncbi:MAG: aldo/keto reductase [Thermoleophilia bacterium]